MQLSDPWQQRRASAMSDRTIAEKHWPERRASAMSDVFTAEKNWSERRATAKGDCVLQERKVRHRSTIGKDIGFTENVDTLMANLADLLVESHERETGLLRASISRLQRELEICHSVDPGFSEAEVKPSLLESDAAAEELGNARELLLRPVDFADEAEYKEEEAEEASEAPSSPGLPQPKASKAEPPPLLLRAERHSTASASTTALEKEEASHATSAPRPCAATAVDDARVTHPNVIDQQSAVPKSLTPLLAAMNSTGSLEPEAEEHTGPPPTCTLPADFKVRDILQDQDNSREKFRNSMRRRSSNGSLKLGYTSSLCQFVEDEMNEKEAVSRRYVLHPQSRVRFSWDLISIVLLVYDILAIPLFVFDLPYSFGLDVIDKLILLFWTLDIPMSCFTGVYVQTALVLDVPSIVRNYAKTWFLFDVIVLLPDWLLVFIDGTATANSIGMARAARGMRYAKYLRLLRLLRVIKAERTFKEMQNRLNNGMAVLMLNICKLALILVVFLHLLACAWYGVGTTSEDGWTKHHGLLSLDFSEKYLYSFQFAMSRMHPSTFGSLLDLRTRAERIFGIIVSIWGICGGGLFVSSVTTKMTQLQSFRQQRMRKLWVIREYMKDHPISSKLAIRVRKYIEKSLDRKLRLQYSVEMAEMLPTGLWVDVHFEAWRPVLNSHSFFCDLCHLHTRAAWCLCHTGIHEKSVLESDQLFSSWDLCSCMRLLTQGCLAYYSNPAMEMDERVVPVLLKRGASVSEAVLWTPWKHRGDMVAVEDSMILSISAEAFLLVLQEYDAVMAQAIPRAHLVVDYLNHNPSLVSDLLPSDSTLRAQKAPPSRSIHHELMLLT
eukprot:TRINITY_DN4948_c0_g3_i1.p1 TRINITY_DN4948_c0_g3~~TRINITY_DN4948_c0_g3_i1.p1  ORF type:complete len:836 (+),score=139.09 TRINITY_DN4948_c0_g3_i1:147-2654(+)